MRNLTRALAIISLICSTIGVLISVGDKNFFEFSGWFSSGMWSISYFMLYKKNR